MSNYAKTTNFATKDALTSGDVNKIVKGAEIDLEFTNIQTAVATKADSASPTITGNAVISGNISLIDGNTSIIGSADATKITKFESDTNIPTGTTVTLAAPATSGTIATTPDNFGRIFLLNYISGYALTNNGATGMDVAAGQAADSTNAVMLYGSALANKTQASWVAGAAAGGKLSVAAMANNTWYYWFALWKTTDGTVDYGFDVATTPTLPSGYTKYRYIGARKTQLAATNWDTFVQHGNEVIWSTPPALDVSATVPTTANRTLTTVNVPAVKVLWKGRVHLGMGAGTAAALVFTDPAASDITQSGTSTANLSDALFSNTTATSILVNAQVECWTNTSSQIGIRGQNATNGFSLQTRGYIDSRGSPV